jgi:adenylosuccinate lyase
MTQDFDHNTFLSPFTWRYGSLAMRETWSDINKRKLWRKIWVALAQAQQHAGLVTEEQIKDLQTYQNTINIERAHEIESEIHHDLMAEVRTFAEQCQIAGGIIHLGATSMDVEDNADAIRLKNSLSLIINQLHGLLKTLAELIDNESHHVCMAFTHLQPAEPTTIGYRLANYAQDLLSDWEAAKMTYARIRGKGLKGAVGTSASYSELLQGSNVAPQELESIFMSNLDLEPFPVAHQTYPRRQDWEIVNVLAGISMTLYRLAFDIRLLQSPPIGEWAEPFGSSQVGSSAMPFKRNPINSENVDSLARYVATLPRVAWDNAAHSLLERTLDDSGNRRVILPEAFLATDEILMRMNRILRNLKINEVAIRRNLETYGVFAASERLLMVTVRNGGDRQKIHEIIREHSLKAWEKVQHGEENPLKNMLRTDSHITQFVPPEIMDETLNANNYIGDAPERAKSLASLIRQQLLARDNNM